MCFNSVVKFASVNFGHQNEKRLDFSLQFFVLDLRWALYDFWYSHIFSIAKASTDKEVSSVKLKPRINSTSL